MLMGSSRLGSAGTACASRAGWLVTRRDDAIKEIPFFSFFPPASGKKGFNFLSSVTTG